MLDGPATAVLCCRGLLVMPVFFLFLSAESMHVQTFQWYRLILSDKVMVVVVRVLTCLTSSRLVMTNNLMRADIFSMSKSYVSVVSLVGLVEL